MPPTPFQTWFDAARATRGLSLREVARKVGVSATTVFHYKRGAMLPTATAQRRLAELLGTPPDEVASLVRTSRIVRGMHRGGRSERPPRLGNRRIKPLGVAFTLYHTRWLPEDYLDRLWAIAGERETTLETALRDALSIALPIMEQRAPR